MVSIAISLIGMGAASPREASELRLRLERTVEVSRIPPGSLGASVVRIDANAPPEEVFSHRGAAKMTPASNIKLLTTAAILDRLGPDFRLATILRTDGPITAGVLDGDLVVVGRGDPGISGRFDPEADPLSIFRDWARALHERGVREVRGSIVVDDSYFDRRYRSTTWPPSGSERWYQAPVSALSFEDNCVGVRVRPTKPGSPASVTLVPPNSFFRIDNGVRTVGRGKNRAGFSISRPAGAGVIRVRGVVAVGSGPDLTFVTVEDPPLWFGGVLKDVLRSEGIHVRGLVRKADSDSAARGVEVARHETPLAKALAVCNKRSQNFFAESFVKILGRERRGEGSWAAGLAEVAEAVEPLGLPRGSYVMEDGSGISRGSLMSASQFTTLLASMRRHPLAATYLESLCASGEEGCAFGRRLRGNGSARENAWAKTGTINGVRSLSGYVRTATGRFYAWSLIVNSPMPAEGVIRRFQDDVVSAILDLG